TKDVRLVAALYDIHANLPALEAVLEDVHRARVDLVVVGGDVLPGPWPAESLARLLELDLPVRFVHGNGELAVLAQLQAKSPGGVTSGGTASGAPLPAPIQEVIRWTARQVRAEHEAVLASWPRTIQFSMHGLGEVLFCHATPQSETDCFTRLTAESL